MANAYKHSGSSVSQEDWDNALELAERWKDVRTDESYGNPGKNLGILARAFRHLKVCYDEMVKLDAVPEARSSKETVNLAQEVDLTIGGHPAYKLTISSRRVHELAKEVLRLNGKEPWDGSVRMNVSRSSKEE